MLQDGLTTYIHYDVISMCSFTSCVSSQHLQAFLAVLARDYEWECNADEKWVTAENQRCADLPVALACLCVRAGMLNANVLWQAFQDCVDLPSREDLCLMIE